MKKLLFLFSASVLVFSSCKKSDTTTAAVSFLPLTTGSFWTYLVTNTTTTTTTSNLTLTVTGKDTTINAKTYKVLSNSTGANNYWAIIGNDYYRFGALPGASFVGSVEELYLKDNAAVAGTWTNAFPFTYNSIPLTITANYKISGIGQTKTVGTNNFTDVTQVHVDFTTALPPLVPTTTLGSGDFYYAKNIGLIAQSVNITANASFGVAAASVKWDIQSYSIK